METCPVCGSPEATEKVVQFETQYRRSDGAIKDLVVPNVTVVHCEACGEQLLGSEAITQVEAAQRAAAAKLSPVDLKIWRTALVKSQTEVAKLLGFGSKTWARWETGAYTLTTAADRYIRLLIAKPENLLFLESLDAQASGIAIMGSVDDLRHYDFDAQDDEFKRFFAEDDPALKTSEAFSHNMLEGRLF